MPPKLSSSAEAEATAEQVTLAKCLARDMEQLRARRQQLEHEIKVRDLAVFTLETDYLHMTTTPTSIISSAAGQARNRDGRPVAAAAAAAATTTQQEQRQPQLNNPVHHLGSLRLGENVSDPHFRGVAIHDRAFSLSNFTALANCGKHGILDTQ